MRAAWALFVTGCAFVSKSAPVELRYFSPEPVAAAGEHREPGCGARLRLGRITPSDHLQSRIAHRESPVEIDLYETLRWTERPDNYVRRALARELFEVRGLAQSTSGRDPTLEVEVVGFDEARHDGHHAGRVQLTYELRDDAVIARGEITKEREVEAAGIAQVVAAIGSAMTDATSELAGRVMESLCVNPGRAPTDGQSRTQPR